MGSTRPAGAVVSTAAAFVIITAAPGVFLGARIANFHFSVVQVVTIEHLHCFYRIGLCGHHYKGKPLRLPSIPVLDQIS